jgi:outer membrane protein
MIRHGAVASIVSLTAIIIICSCPAERAVPVAMTGTGGRSSQIAAAGDSLDLGECIELAMRNNPRIESMRWKVEQAHALRDKAAGRRLPDLTGTGGYSIYSATERMAPPREPGYPLVYADEVLSWSVRASMPIFTGGRISNEIGALDLLEDSAKNSLEFSRGRIIYETTVAYYGILQHRMTINSLEFSRKAISENLEKTKALIEARKETRADMLKLEVRLADIIQRIEHEKGLLAVEKLSLSNLMGIEGERFTVRSAGGARPDEPIVGIAEALDSAYLRRADYLAAVKEIEAQKRRVSSARASYWPSVSLFASYTGNKAVGSYIEMPGASSVEDIARAGCMIEVPIFEGGRRGADLDSEKARLAVLEEGLRYLELQIRLEVESAIYQIESISKRLAAMEKAVEQAMESLRIEREKYELGKGRVADVLDAESTLLEMRTARYIAMTDYNVQLARLRFATGDNDVSDR